MECIYMHCDQERKAQLTSRKLRSENSLSFVISAHKSAMFCESHPDGNSAPLY
jgi:hypothetical protein